MLHADLNQLLNSLLPFAQRMLAEHGEFLPFGRTMKPDGEIEAVAAYDSDEHPPSQIVIDLMTRALRRQAQSGQFRAVGICYDSRTVPPGQTEKCDAVCASMEHQSGEAVNVILPFEKTSKGDIQYGQLFTTRRTPQFFVPNETAISITGDGFAIGEEAWLSRDLIPTDTLYVHASSALSRNTRSPQTAPGQRRDPRPSQRSLRTGWAEQ